jgi:hypothetical protein
MFLITSIALQDLSKVYTINDKSNIKFKYPTGIHFCSNFINLIYSFFIFLYTDNKGLIV